MTTQKQLQANRRNAVKATGPRTREGKTKSSRNALKHGLLSKQIILPDEAAGDFDSLHRGIQAHLEPEGELECEMVYRLAHDFWRLRRIGRIEAEVLTRNVFLEREARATARASKFVRYEPGKDPLNLDFLTQAPTTSVVITDEAAHKRAESEAAEAREMADSEATLLGGAFLRDLEKLEALGKLSRYETAIRRNLQRTLHELQRLQAVRRGIGAPTPAAVDVDVSVAKAPEPRPIRLIGARKRRAMDQTKTKS